MTRSCTESDRFYEIANVMANPVRILKKVLFTQETRVRTLKQLDWRILPGFLREKMNTFSKHSDTQKATLSQHWNTNKKEASPNQTNLQKCFYVKPSTKATRHFDKKQQQ